MAEFFNSNMESCEEEQAAYAMIPINEYNGLKKALRLYYEKKEGKEEEKGRFKVLEQKFERYQDGRSRFLAWHTSVILPYSSDFGFREVVYLAKEELEGYLGRIRVYRDIRDLDNVEIAAAIEWQDFMYRPQTIEENNFGIFYTSIKYNGRNDSFEMIIKSLKEIPIALIHGIP